jgi:hypothetical protein
LEFRPLVFPLIPEPNLLRVIWDTPAPNQLGGSREEEVRRDGRRGGTTAEAEDENAKLKRLVADLSLDKAILQDVLRRQV